MFKRNFLRDPAGPALGKSRFFGGIRLAEAVQDKICVSHRATKQRRGATARPGEFILSSAGVAECHQKIVGFDVSLDFFASFFVKKKRRRIG